MAIKKTVQKSSDETKKELSAETESPDITIYQRVKIVNEILQEGEPNNVSHDTYSGYIGYSPQGIIDAINEVFGIHGWGFTDIITKLAETNKELAISNIEVWVGNEDHKVTAYGQSRVTRGDIGDALKGAQTDAIKKALSYFSIGNRAYLGLLEAPKDAKPAGKPATGGTFPATEKQRGFIFRLGKDLGLDEENTKKYIKQILKLDSFAQLTISQAKEVIDRMIKAQKAQADKSTDQEAQPTLSEREELDKGEEEIRPDDIPF